MYNRRLSWTECAEVNDLHRLNMQGLLPSEAFFKELERVRNAINAGTCSGRTLGTGKVKVRAKVVRAKVCVRINTRVRVEARDRTDGNVNLILRRLGIGWREIRSISVKHKVGMLRDKMLQCGFSDVKFKPVLDFVADEEAWRQDYSNELKAVLKWIAEEKLELVAQRAEHLKKKKQRERENEAASALLELQ